uniref:Integrase catalytic domain-containing protein n=1 Tax=Clytia hemisphaerica TaxID=252671 RepID=A0A7M5XN02_9CNID
SQVDLAGPFLSYTNHNKRKTIKIWLVVFVCSTTSTTSIKVMDDYSSPAFFQAFTRFACDTGYPKSIFVDRGSQILKTYNNTTINFHDTKYKLHYHVDVEFELCPVDGHNYNGKVERRIREIKRSLTKSYNDQRLSVLQWETVASEISNCINDLPISLGNYVSDFESMDLITPNRLKLGRNNERSPVGPFELSNDSSRIIQTNSLIYQSWFDSWLINHVPKLINQPKWFKSDTDIRIGDVVLFLKNSPLKLTYQYGMVEDTVMSKDNKIRQVKVCYRNHSENCNRTTVRHVRELIVIHYVNEKSIIEQLNDMADQC